MESWAVHALERVMVGAVMAMGMGMGMCLHVAPAQVRLWFNEEIESA